MSKETAKEIRKVLKENYPQTKFSVRTQHHTTVRISWQDGPSPKQIEKLTNKFLAGYFDGMQDMYIYTGNGAKFIFTEREVSPSNAKIIFDTFSTYKNIDQIKFEIKVSSYSGEYYHISTDSEYDFVRQIERKIYETDFTQTVEEIQIENITGRYVILEDNKAVWVADKEQADLFQELLDASKAKVEKIIAYQEKLAAKKERYLARAEKARAESSAAYQTSKGIISMIPFGQPILVDHYSAKRHRRDLEKSDNAMRKSIELDKKADYYQERAENMSSNISSDDPQAAEKLQEQLNKLTEYQERMKNINKAYRAFKKSGEKALEGLSEDDKRIILNWTPTYSYETAPIMPYMMSNNLANIKRIEQRIKTIKATQKAEGQEREYNTTEGLVKVAYEENRVRLFFDGKPSEEVRKSLKSNGFRWSPNNKAWQGFLNNGTIYKAKTILESIKA